MVEASKPESDTPNIEQLVLKGKETIESVLEWSGSGFFDTGDRYSFDQIVAPDDWAQISEDEKGKFLNGMGQILGINIISPSDEETLRSEFQEGVEGTPTEKGADVAVLKTELPGFELHVMHYRNPDLGTQYDLVKI